MSDMSVIEISLRRMVGAAADGAAAAAAAGLASPCPAPAGASGLTVVLIPKRVRFSFPKQPRRPETHSKLPDP